MNPILYEAPRVGKFRETERSHQKRREEGIMFNEYIGFVMHDGKDLGYK